MPRLALLRHGHTTWNREGRIQGRTDVPLDGAARAQLQQLHLPAPWDRAPIWSSPLSRASETAKIVSGRLPAGVDGAGDGLGLRQPPAFSDQAQSTLCH